MKRRIIARVPVGADIPGTFIRVLAGPLSEAGFGALTYTTVFYLEVEVDDGKTEEVEDG